jgi:hypothetical protein
MVVGRYPDNKWSLPTGVYSNKKEAEKARKEMIAKSETKFIKYFVVERDFS